MRLMLLDRDPDARAAVEQVARDAQHSLEVPDTIDAALACCAGGRIECVIVSPSFFDGDREARQVILAAVQSAPAVAVVIAAQSPAQMRSTHPGDHLVQDFVVKPLHPDVLAARLELVDVRRKSRSREQAMLAVLPDMMFRVTTDGTYLDVHAPDEADLYVPRAELIGKNVVDLLPPEVATRLRAMIQETVHTGKPCSLVYELAVPSGSTHFEARMVRASPNEVLSIVRDISEQSRLLTEIQQHRANARAFASRTLQVLEAERQHLAQELHDVIGQMLLVHRMDVEWIAKRADGPMSTAANALAGALNETLEAVRDLALGLRPPILDDLGIGSALEQLTGEMTRRSGVAIQCIIDPAAASLSRDAGVTLYRIAQEALSNALRHANCQNIELSLARPNGKVLLRVEDDGRGIDQATIAMSSSGEGRSLGLLGMQERAALLGGDVQVLPRTPSGTVILAHIPQPESLETGDR